MRMGFRGAVVLSLTAHALAAVVGYGYLAWQRSRDDSMQIDLSRSSLLPPVPRLAAYTYKPPEDWYVGAKIRIPPRPAPVLHPLTPVAEAESGAPSAPPCPPPCPSAWASASNAVQKPQWLDGMITEDDYPEDARYKNITGRVVVQISIDTQGAVQDVKLLQGADPSLDAKTLEKLRQARFSPCVDAEGKPFPCTLRLPIDWTLE